MHPRPVDTDRGKDDIVTLTVNEVLGLQDEIEKLVDELAEAIEPDADGKRRIRKAERRRIIRLCLALASHLVLEALD